MPKLWNETIDGHRREVREAILDAAAALVDERGLLSVTMSQIAEKAGIGRATLYKYFPEVEAVLLAWHERRITAHLGLLARVRDNANGTAGTAGTAGAGGRLAAVLEAFALISYESHGHHDTDIAAFLHRDEHVVQARRHLYDMVRDLLAEGAAAGDIRGDVTPDELAGYCLHALTAASRSSSEDAVRRLVAVTLAGLRPPG